MLAKPMDLKFLLITFCFLMPALANDTRTLTELNVEQARVLIDNVTFVLDLRGLTTLRPDVAAELAKHKGSLTLSGLTTITPEIAQRLATCQGTLFLDGLTTLAPETAAELAKCKGVLILGLTTLLPETAAELAKRKGKLHLERLTTISPETAAELAKFKGILMLNGLKTVSPESAAELAKCDCELVLSGLTTISPETAAELAKCKNTLHLEGLRTISLESAAALAKCKAALNLWGLRDNSLEVEEALKQHQGGGLQLGPHRDRKGKITSQTFSKVFVNSDEQLQVGGTSDLLIANETDGVVLKVSVVDLQTQQSSFRYIAYPIEKEAKPELKLVKEIGPGCYWNRRNVYLGAPKTHTIFEMDRFEVATGPFRGWLIQKPGNTNEVTISANRDGRLGYFIGVTTGYDNLSDGK